MKRWWIFALYILAGCATKPVALDLQKSEGQWETKMQVRDLTKNTTHNLSLDVMAIKNKFLRMEVSGSMGIRAASLLLKGAEIQYIIYSQKRVYYGAADEGSLVPVLHSSVDPNWFYNVFFDEPIRGQNWRCQMGSNHLIESCVRSAGAADQVTVLWLERNGENKRVIISGAKFEIQILVKGFMTKVQSPDKAFQLDAPGSYTRYKID